MIELLLLMIAFAGWVSIRYLLDRRKPR